MDLVDAGSCCHLHINKSTLSVVQTSLAPTIQTNVARCFRGSSCATVYQCPYYCGAAHLNNEKRQQLGLKRGERQETLSPFLPPDSLPFLFLFSRQLRSHGSHTPKPRAFNHAREVLRASQWAAPIPWSVHGRFTLVFPCGTRPFVCELM